MKYEFEWLDSAQTILLIRALALWDWNDVESALAEQLKQIRSVPHDVYTVYELTLSPTLPKGLAVPKLKRITAERLPNQRLTIYVGMGFLQQQMMDVTKTAFQLNPVFDNFRFVKTMDEALFVIEKHKRDSENVC